MTYLGIFLLAAFVSWVFTGGPIFALELWSMRREKRKRDLENWWYSWRRFDSDLMERRINRILRHGD